MKSNIVLAVTIGDPGGIGPEIALKAVCHKCWPRNLHLVLIGNRDIIRQQAKQLRIPIPPAWHPSEKKIMASPVVNWEPDANSPVSPKIGKKNRRIRISWRPGMTGKTHGRAAAQWIRSAVYGCQAGWFNGMITGPISKKSFQMAEISYPGHTEYLAYLTGTRHYAMMLIGGPLRVVLVTRHVPLSSVPALLSRNNIVEAVQLTNQAMDWLDSKCRKIGVCALNPHAGDQGLLGREEIDIIIPAIQSLRRRHMDVDGPIPADVIFNQAMQKQYGAVIAMYHDQGLAPLKMIAFKTGVNLTLGLPIIRTSPDHGTAFDIAGKGKAFPDSMIAAIRLAAELAERKNPWS